MTKIVFLGAGSTVFAQDLLGDLLSYPEFSEITIGLHDIDEKRLRTTEVVAGKIAQQLGTPPTIEASLDRRAALEGADYAIGMYQIGGYKPATVVDFEIPKKASASAETAIGGSACRRSSRASTKTSHPPAARADASNVSMATESRAGVLERNP